MSTTDTTATRTSQLVTDDNGAELGWATWNGRTWSLCQPNGLDLVKVATDLDDAKVVLADHRSWVEAGCPRD